jgi:phosphonate transport system permease protein
VRPSRNSITAAVLLLGLLAFSLWSLGEMDLRIDFTYAMSFLERTVPFAWPSLADALWFSTLTLAIVISGTVMAAVLSIPVAYLAAKNTSPAGGTRWLGRFLSVTSRAAPDAIMAMIFALVIGQGALAGVLALGLHSIGMISKLTADAIEQIDEGPRLALRAAGATRGQEFWGAIWPQIMPSFIATVLHRTDINLRVSVILGFVGVSGLGYELSHALNTLNYREAMPWAIIIFVLCVAFEIVSSVVRKTLLGVQPTGRGLGDRIVRRASKAPAGPELRPATAHGRIRPWTGERVKTTAFAWIAVVAIGASVVISATQGSNFTNFWTNAGIAFNRLWPPALAESKWEATAEKLFETVQIAGAATLVALLFSIVIGSFAARNVAPNGGVRTGFRFLLVGIRGLPELLLCIFFIILTGLGPGAAVIALGIGGVGLLGKLMADSLEEVNPGPERALRATGATRAQIFASATLPQAAPAFIGHILYLFDTNIRAATILGIVGAGGIGYMLAGAARINQHELLVLLLCVLVIVFIVEALSSWIRQLIK